MVVIAIGNSEGTSSYKTCGGRGPTNTGSSTAEREAIRLSVTGHSELKYFTNSKRGNEPN